MHQISSRSLMLIRSQARLTSVNVLKFPQPRSTSAVAYFVRSMTDPLFKTQFRDGELSASGKKNLPSIFKHMDRFRTYFSGHFISTTLSSATNSQDNRRNYSFKSKHLSFVPSINLESIELNRILYLLLGMLFVVIWNSSINTTEAAEESKASLEDEDFATPRVDDLTSLANLPPKLEFPYYQVLNIFMYRSYILLTLFNNRVPMKRSVGCGITMSTPTRAWRCSRASSASQRCGPAHPRRCLASGQAC